MSFTTRSSSWTKEQWAGK